MPSTAELNSGWSKYYESGDIKHVAALFADSFTFSFNGNVSTNAEELHAGLSGLIALSPSQPDRWNYWNHVEEGKHGKMMMTLITTFNSGKTSTCSGPIQYVLNDDGKIIIWTAFMAAADFGAWMQQTQEASA